MLFDFCFSSMIHFYSEAKIIHTFFRCKSYIGNKTTESLRDFLPYSWKTIFWLSYFYHIYTIFTNVPSSVWFKTNNKKKEKENHSVWRSFFGNISVVITVSFIQTTLYLWNMSFETCPIERLYLYFFYPY